MSSTSDGHEREIKLRLESAAQGLSLLAGAGLQVTRERVFESNVIFDHPSLKLRERDLLLRVRRTGAEGLLTFKGPGNAGRHKVREEIETTLGLPGEFERVLERLDFAPAFRYEKYRTEFHSGPGVITLDETPIGVFLELEGPADWIDSTAAALGFRESDYITSSYVRLYMEDCRRRGIPPTNLTFPPK